MYHCDNILIEILLVGSQEYSDHVTLIGGWDLGCLCLCYSYSILSEILMVKKGRSERSDETPFLTNKISLTIL